MSIIRSYDDAAAIPKRVVLHRAMTATDIGIAAILCETSIESTEQVAAIAGVTEEQIFSTFERLADIGCASYSRANDRWTLDIWRHEHWRDKATETRGRASDSGKPAKEWYERQELADRLNVSLRTIDRRVKRGEVEKRRTPDGGFGYRVLAKYASLVCDENKATDNLSDEGWVYILENESLECLKVGYTTRSPKERASELSRQSSIPTRFVVSDSHECDNPRRVEQAAHELLSQCRVSDSSEFFDVSVDRAVDAIERADMEVNGE